jgi:ankyrin repeat protein
MNARDEDGLTPLHLAALCNHLDIVASLLEAGADVNARITTG